MITKGLPDLAAIYLDFKAGYPIVKQKMFGQWQELLTFCPPLILIAASYNRCNVRNAVSINHTALLFPDDEDLQLICCECKGFNDLHIHLNGTIEIDNLWQDMLSKPSEYCKAYDDVHGKALIIEQAEQEAVFRNANHLHELLLRAQALRYYMVVKFIDKGDECYPDTDAIRDQMNLMLTPGVHPYKINQNYTLLRSEFEMHCKLFELLGTLENKEKIDLAHALHHYLLILGSVNRYVVQQKHQNGFQQFQKIADNDFRKASEETYDARFHQLFGNEANMPFFYTIEGRIAPKSTPAKVAKFTYNIGKGWAKFVKDKNSTAPKELRLITHFIKKPEGNINNTLFRHDKLRHTLWEQAHAQISLLDDPLKPLDRQFQISLSNQTLLSASCPRFVGFDAAASEFDTSPEVFAPIYRLLRKRLPEYGFTYHVGEDFIHPVSGLRAIYEAVAFLEMQPGDRLGHATALGVCPKMWMERIGTSVFIKQGEWLDDLLFVAHINPCLFKSKHDSKLESEIKILASKVYNLEEETTSIQVLIDAWLCRRWMPDIFCGLESDCADCDDERNAISKLTYSDEIKSLVYKYHFNKECRERHNKIILVNQDIVNASHIHCLQKKLCRQIRKQNIIIETLPTSNVRIGIYKDHTEHHIRQFLKNRLCVVIGSDDAGIFATNTYNEYAHVWQLIKRKRKTMKKLIKNSNKYIFRGCNDLIK